MIRWLVRKVVKYALEELRESGELDRLALPPSRNAATDTGSLPAADTGDGLSSDEALADLLASRGRPAKVSDIGSTKKVEGDRDRNRAVMDQLRNLGD